MKLTTDYERDREEERRSKEWNRLNRVGNAERLLALATRERCPCVETSKQLLELRNHSPSITSLNKTKEKFRLYAGELRQRERTAPACRHGLLFSSALAADRPPMLAQLHSWNFISFKSLDTFQQNIFHWAVRRQAVQCLTELSRLFSAEVGKWIMDKDVNGVTPIHLASRLPSNRVLKLLLHQLGEEGHYLCCALLDSDGRSPLHYACSAGSLACVKTLLGPVDHPLDQRDSHGITPLMFAVGGRSTHERDAIIRLLVQKKPVSIPVRCKRGIAAAHYAVMANNLSGLGALLEELKDAAEQSLDSEQRSPLHYAALHGRADVAELLMRRGGANNDIRDCHNIAPSHYAAQGGDFATMQAICRHSRPIDTPLDNERRTPFMWAVVFQREELVRRMLAEKAIWINKAHRDRFHYTALHLAALGGNRNICRLLMEDGFSPLDRDMFEATPEHLAAGQGHHEALMYFAYKRAGPGQIPLDAMGMSPLAYACLGGQAYAVEMMLQGQPSLDLRQVDSMGRTVLHCAVMANSLSSLEVLIKYGIDPTLRDLEGATAFDLAVKLGFKGLQAFLGTQAVATGQLSRSFPSRS